MVHHETQRVTFKDTIIYGAFEEWLSTLNALLVNVWTIASLAFLTAKHAFVIRRVEYKAVASITGGTL